MELDTLQIAALLSIMFVAAVARGYAGFGSSAIVIASASLFIAPAKLVPVLYVLEVGASIAMFPAIRREVDYPIYWRILAGCTIGIPLGQFLLTNWPPDTVRVALSIAVLACAILLWRGFRLGFPMGKTFALLTGLLTGLGSGLAVIGGLVMVVILYATEFGAARTRAMCIAVFLAMYSYGIGISVLNGLFTTETVWLILLLTPPLLAGIWIGQRSYLATTPERFRQFLLVFLMALALVGVVRALVF